MKKFYIARPPQHLGCFSLEEVVAKLCSGEFRMDDFAFTEGFTDWKMISEIPELMEKLKSLQELNDILAAPAPTAPESPVSPPTSPGSTVQAAPELPSQAETLPSPVGALPSLASPSPVAAKPPSVPDTPPPKVLLAGPRAPAVPTLPPADPYATVDTASIPAPAPMPVSAPMPASAPMAAEPEKKGFFGRIFGKKKNDATASALIAAPAPVAAPGPKPASAPMPAPGPKPASAPMPAPASGVPAAQDLAAVTAPVPAAASVLHEIPPKPIQTDQVNFSAMAQGQLEAGAQFILDIWAHTPSQTEQVKVRANEMGRGDLKGTKQGVGIVQGSVLEVHLNLPDFEVADPFDLLTWNGEPVNASFPVTAPKDCTEGSHLGTASIHSHGLMICKLHFQIEIGVGACAASEDLTIKTERPRTAFASYSSQNRDEVLGCLQGMQKVAPDLDVTIDVDALRSGQNWHEELGRLIPSKDVFYLFWSKPASESEVVKWEWQLALNNKGLGCIDPVPLEDPRQVPPPAELSSLHFGDKWLAFKKTAEC